MGVMGVGGVERTHVGVSEDLNLDKSQWHIKRIFSHHTLNQGDLDQREGRDC